jgi:hypothetical protein
MKQSEFVEQVLGITLWPWQKEALDRFKYRVKGERARVTDRATGLSREVMIYAEDPANLNAAIGDAFYRATESLKRSAERRGC